MNHYAGGNVMDKKREIERVAYELYEKSGCKHGREAEHWIEAEKIVHARHAGLVAEKPAGAKKTVTAKAAPVKAAAKGKTTPAGKAPGKSATKSKSKKTGTSQKEANL